MQFGQFQYLLAELHSRREADPRRLQRPYLRMSRLPKAMLSEDLGAVVECMNGTCFCAPDRYKDRVSLEILAALQTKAADQQLKVAYSICVRYMMSPRGLALRLANAGRAELPSLVSAARKGHATYRQTGTLKAQLARGAMAAAADVVAKPTGYGSFTALEDKIAAAVRRRCGGTKTEHFSARQAAADLCKSGIVRVAGLAEDGRPTTSRTGCGAAAGHYLAERAKGVKKHLVRIPKTLPYQEQTETCEYGKLVKRINFPYLQKRAAYRPAALK